MSGNNEENKKLVAEKSYIPPVGPTGHHVAIRTISAREEYLEPGSKLEIPADVAKAYENASGIGFVMQVGPNCWKDQPTGRPWCKVGDRVAFTRHAGVPVILGKEIIRVVNDIDVYYVYPRNE